MRGHIPLALENLESPLGEIRPWLRSPGLDVRKGNLRTNFSVSPSVMDDNETGLRIHIYVAYTCFVIRHCRMPRVTSQTTAEARQSCTLPPLQNTQSFRPALRLNSRKLV